MQLRTLGLHGVCSELATTSRCAGLDWEFRGAGVFIGRKCRQGCWALAAGIVGRVVELECGCRKGGCLDVVVWCAWLGAHGIVEQLRFSFVLRGLRV